MGFPNLYTKLRKVKGTQFFVVRDLLALGTVSAGFCFALGFWWFSPAVKKFAKEFENGEWDDSPEMKKRKFLLRNILIPKSSTQIQDEIEEDRLFTNVLGRTTESPFG